MSELNFEIINPKSIRVVFLVFLLISSYLLQIHPLQVFEANAGCKCGPDWLAIHLAMTQHHGEPKITSYTLVLSHENINEVMYNRKVQVIFRQTLI